MSNSRVAKGYAIVPDGDRINLPSVQMAAFDKLPLKLRRAVDYCAFQISAWHVREHHRKHGAKATLREVAESERLFLIAASKETGVPICETPLRTPTRRSSRSIRSARFGFANPPLENAGSSSCNSGRMTSAGAA
jgi:hypothetical protein